ncbi:MAG: DNA primase [Nitrosopumilaceae archaeon]
MIDLGKEDLAKYPFLAEAGEYIRDRGFNLEEFGHSDFKPVLEKAYNRIQVATTGKIYNSDLHLDNLDSEILSFVISIIMLKSVGISSLTRRFSLAEARRAERYLQQDINRSKDSSRVELAFKILRDVFSIDVNIIHDDFVISISDYVHRAIHFHEKEWKLVNRRVENGLVYLNSHETVRLIRRELDNYINSKIQSVSIPSVPKAFDEYVSILRSLAKKFTSTFEISTEYPPCIKHAIQVLDKGENLSHSGRFMLATFLLTKGKNIEQIVPLFKNAPDYNEKVTRYQLEHLAGKTGAGKKYSCPSCDKIRSEDLCFEIPECNNIINPLQFGKKRIKNA